MNNPDVLVQMTPIGELKPDPRNPRTISKREFEALKKSIAHYGFIDPIIANQRNSMVIGGHMRLEAARELGMLRVPVVWVNLTDKQAAALNVTLNKISGDFDSDMLVEMLADLDAELLELTGFDEDELAQLTADPFDDETGELIEPATPKTKRYSAEQLRRIAKSYHPQVADDLLDFINWLDRQDT